MATTLLDLSGFKCPLPVLKTRKALKSLAAGEQLEVHCTDPLAGIDIPNLIRETGDEILSQTQSDRRIVFLIARKSADP